MATNGPEEEQAGYLTARAKASTIEGIAYTAERPSAQRRII
jgi:hypothetical protein